MSVACVFIEGEVDRPGHQHNFVLFFTADCVSFLVVPEATFKGTSSCSFMSPFQQKEATLVYRESGRFSLLHFFE